MELGPGTRQNLNAQRCTWSSIGFSVFSLCLYVLGFYKNPTVNKYSYFYGSHCLLRRVFLPATPFYQATSHIVRWPARAIFTSGDSALERNEGHVKEEVNGLTTAFSIHPTLR